MAYFGMKSARKSWDHDKLCSHKVCSITFEALRKCLQGKTQSFRFGEKNIIVMTFVLILSRLKFEKQ